MNFDDLDWAKGSMLKLCSFKTNQITGVTSYFKMKILKIKLSYICYSVEPKVNTRKGSIIKAVRRFRRNTAPDILDQGSSAVDVDILDQGSSAVDVNDVTVSESSTDYPSEDDGLNTSQVDVDMLPRKKSASASGGSKKGKKEQSYELKQMPQLSYIKFQIVLKMEYLSKPQFAFSV